MVSNPEKTTEEKDHAEAEEFIRSVVAGHPQGAVRRIILYIVLGLCIVIGLVTDGIFGLLSGGFAIVALLLLAMSDQLA